ncbi:hypothetical protein Rhe02_05380 [Rhizocola hellebori]|uniref:Adenylyl-sulfate kinase n=1 Tax=Rhizocola hellebori TaxID=1392758 RepID=A0A8J3VDH8_9ACTN|nr:hypothetical protein [Rhizocola hellebori]GIH02471.1 hypothetical protein Rhe02_05380 [Rhizocola hellebori]
MYQALLLIGVGGVGKSTVADAIGRVLTAAGTAVAVVDTDALAQFGPPPTNAGVPVTGFYDGLKCINLAALWANYKAIGARHIVVSAGIDTAAWRSRFAASLAGCTVQVVRLVAAPDTVRARLRGRDGGLKLERHLTALTEHEAILDAARIEDFAVVNERPPDVVATEIVTRAGWIGSLSA